jgi:arylsulfatase A-like enzyme
MPHVPLFASEQFKGKSKGGIYGDVIEELDWSVGRIVRAVKESGVSDRTLIVFTSDNGPWTMFKEFGGTAKPLRGEKGTGWEGGSGVPAIFYWPGKIRPGVSSEFMVNIDIYATVAALVGCELPKSYVMDSLDFSGVLLNGQASPRTNYLFFPGARWREPFSYRSGGYKIHIKTNDRSRHPATGRTARVNQHDPPLLFNLRKDRSESTNIARQDPDMLDRMLKEFRASVFEITATRLELQRD